MSRNQFERLNSVVGHVVTHSAASHHGCMINRAEVEHRVELTVFSEPAELGELEPGHDDHPCFELQLATATEEMS